MRAWVMAGVVLVGCGGGEASIVEEPGGPSTGRGVDEQGLPVWRDAHVLLVTVDALRADRLGAYGYARGITPGMDALAEEGVVFERAYAQAPHSSWSLCSLMTGEYLHEVALLGRGLPEKTLAGELGEAGYATAAFFTNGIFYTDGEALEPYQDGLGFEEWEHDNPDAEERTDRALALVDRLVDEGEPPSFVWVHYFDPHEPYEDTSIGSSTPDRYDAEVRNADRGVARLVREARARFSRDVIVVLSADHGEELRDHGGVSHGSTVYDEQVRVPLIVNAPGLEPRRVEGPVELVDVAPTVLRLLGREPPAGMRGDDLRPEMVGRDVPARPAFAAVATRRMVVDWPLKLVADLPRGRMELFDLEADPGEQRNLAEERDAEPLVRLLHRWHDSLRAPPAGTASDDPVERALDHGRLQDDRAVPALTEIVGDEAVAPEHRAEAARLLAGLSATNARDALAEAVVRAEPPVSTEAALALGALGDRRAAPRLRALLDDEGVDPDARARAALALGRLGLRDAVPPLLELLESDRPFADKRDALHHLYRLRDPRAADVLLDLVDESHYRYMAITALGLSRADRAVEPLLERLAGPTRVMVRDGIVRALGWLGDRRAVPPIVERAVADPELIYATESLVRLGAIREGAIGGADVGPATPGRRGFGDCHRGDPLDVTYRWHTWCETSAPVATVRLQPLDGEALAVLSARRTDARSPAEVTLRLGDDAYSLQIPPTWTELRVPVASGRVPLATLEVGEARVAVDHLLLLPAVSAAAEEDAALDEPGE